MMQVFVASSPQNACEAGVVGRALEEAGYRLWANTTGRGPGAQSYHRDFGAGVLGSAAVVVLWSDHAARDEWVERAMQLGQRLMKALFVVRLDESGLPPTLVGARIYSEPKLQAVTEQMSADLRRLGHEHPVHDLAAQLASPVIRERRAGIERAAELLASGQWREKILALLEYVGRTDLYSNVQEQAQAVLDVATLQETPPAPPDESRHRIGARCRQGHVTYFDRRKVCGANRALQRGVIRRAGVELDLLALSCQECGQQINVRVDCEGYR